MSVKPAGAVLASWPSAVFPDCVAPELLACVTHNAAKKQENTSAVAISICRFILKTPNELFLFRLALCLTTRVRARGYDFAAIVGSNPADSAMDTASESDANASPNAFAYTTGDPS